MHQPRKPAFCSIYIRDLWRPVGTSAERRILRQCKYGLPNAVCADEAKRFQEAITMAYHTFHGLETRIVLDFQYVYPRMRLNDGRLPALLDRPFAEKTFTIFGDGSQTRSFCYVDDLVEGFIDCCCPIMPNPEHWQPR